MTVKFIRAVAIGFIVLFSFCAVARSETKCKNKEECYKQYSKKGKAYFENEDYENAIIYFLKALNEKPDTTVVMTYLGICYCKTGKIEDSVDLLNQAIEIAPEAPEARIANQWLEICAPEPPPREPTAPEGMADIPAGEYWMGCVPEDNECQDNEKPRVKVYVDQFYMDKYEVTNEEYEKCVESGECKSQYEGQCVQLTSSGTGEKPASELGWEFRGDSNPVVCVDWDMAKSYCAWAGKRLPTEAEWEKAARGGTETKYYWGGNMNGECAWYIENSGNRAPESGKVAGYDKEDWESNKWGGKTHPAGQKKPNGYGLYDMLGNVWEWVEDCYDGGWYGKLNSGQRNPVYNCTDSGVYRVLRGGSWTRYALNLRVSFRKWGYPDGRSVGLGFRCAQDLKIP